MLKSILLSNSQEYELNPIPPSLQILLNKIELKKYGELYEVETDGNTSLQDDLNAVLQILSHKNKSITHLRYIWMTLILTLAVKPTLEYYDSSNLLPEIIIELIQRFLHEALKNKSESIKINADNLDRLIERVFELHVSYYNREGINTQAISEALDVFYNAMRVIDYNHAIEAILEILYDCLEGYAIFPGSYGRRELFDWWLLDVVPASYNFLPTKLFYVVEGVEHKEEIKLRQAKLLNKISREIWSDLLDEISSNQTPKLSVQESIVKSKFSYKNDVFSNSILINNV